MDREVKEGLLIFTWLVALGCAITGMVIFVMWFNANHIETAKHAMESCRG